MNSAFKSRATIMKIVSKPVHAESLQSCPTLCNPMDCSPPVRLLCPWDSPGKNTGVGGHSLLQGIFLTQGSNPGLLHCRQILDHLSHQGRQVNLEYSKKPSTWQVHKDKSGKHVEPALLLYSKVSLKKNVLYKTNDSVFLA